MSDAVEKVKDEEREKAEKERADRAKAARGEKGVGQLGETYELVKEYVTQETVGPLRGAGRWIAFGSAGAVLLGFGSFLIILGVLRVLQTTTGDTFEGEWMMLVPYLISLVLAGIVIAIAVSRIGKKTLNTD